MVTNMLVTGKADADRSVINPDLWEFLHGPQNHAADLLAGKAVFMEGQRVELADLSKVKNYWSKGVAEKAAPSFGWTVNLTGDMAQYGPDIRRFVDAMVYKLEKNAHKGRWDGLTVEQAFALLEKEVAELRAELFSDDGSFKLPNMVKVLLEAGDVANFALIASAIVMERGR